MPVDFNREFNPNGVTVVTPTVPPRARLLEEAKESVQAQMLLPEDHIIVMDEDVEGEAPTRNRGIMAVKTKWTAFLDDDDLFLPHHLNICINHAEATGVDLVYPWFYVKGGVDPLGEFGMPFRPDVLRQRNYIPVTYVVRTELAQSVGGCPLPNSKAWPHDTCVDWGFLLRMLDAGGKFTHLPERSWVWRHHDKNTSGFLWKEIYDET